MELCKIELVKLVHTPADLTLAMGQLFPVISDLSLPFIFLINVHIQPFCLQLFNALMMDFLIKDTQVKRFILISLV
jgi:hypothetical protein